MFWSAIVFFLLYFSLNLVLCREIMKIALHKHLVALFMVLAPTLSLSQGMRDSSASRLSEFLGPESARQGELLNAAHPRIFALGRGLTQRGIPWARYLSSPGDEKLFVGYTRDPSENEFSCVTMSAYSQNLEQKNGRERLVRSSISMWIGEDPAENILFDGVSRGSVTVASPILQTQVWISALDEHGVAIIITNVAGRCE
ncbi:MAG: hypothetical protein ABJO67_16470 [Pseudoruegeria sp.]